MPPSILRLFDDGGSRRTVWPTLAWPRGKRSGLIVLDVDVAHGGLQSLAQLEHAHEPLPDTPTVTTGSGGRHYYFRCPVGQSIGNRAGIRPGIDVRGNNGYVVAPPSIHASGNRYEWLVPLETPLARSRRGCWR